MLLDLSAAFDTVDHDILITRLKHHLGITGKALGWIQSYISGRNQFVKIGTEHSSSQNLICGVPQGSVLCPILYSLYTSPLTDIISKHNMNHHIYTDDTDEFTCLLSPVLLANHLHPNSALSRVFMMSITGCQPIG